MARRAGGISLKGATTTGAGTAVAIFPPSTAVSFVASAAGSTEDYSVRAQVSIDRNTWTNAGGAATTFTSTQDGTIARATAGVQFTYARLIVTVLGSTDNVITASIVG